MMVQSVLGPLDPAGRVPPWQQTRLGAFLVAGYGALASSASAQSLWTHGPVAIALQQQAAVASGIVGAIMRGVAWQWDPWWMARASVSQAAWLPRLAHGPDVMRGLALDSLALGLAIVTVVRPAPLLPPDASPDDPFVAALGLVELESGRLLQPNLRLLRQMAEEMPRSVVEEAVEARLASVQRLWNAVLASLASSA
ncbi:hypothetical protein [Sabulicella rubraurantiaca]|uniref:hypothetical protein n=1 Tax=Sabulicella rubraurantiaca TaxID=2811429 RepID=UPI001A95EA93|nr:hypothetical protein [Sabulicella rubraurantiaca]